jgi:hypothetical protein
LANFVFINTVDGVSADPYFDATKGSGQKNLAVLATIGNLYLLGQKICY